MPCPSFLEKRFSRLFKLPTILLTLGCSFGLVPILSAQDEEEPEPVERGVIFNTAVEQKAVFTSGEGYKFYRIPSLVTTGKGTLLAFCEGRFGPSDSGRIDLLVKSSHDGGNTWGPAKRIAGDKANTWGNPCPVIDRSTGRTWIFMSQNLGDDNIKKIIAQKSAGSRTIWVSHSDNDGETWSAPANITATTKNPDWTWCATGPGIGIQTQSGRLVIPCNFTDSAKNSGSYVIYSDDHGQTWKHGGNAFPKTNESQVVQLEDGRLLMSSRPSGSLKGLLGKEKIENRMFSWSKDEGQTWSTPAIQEDIRDPRCQGSIIQISNPSLLIFSNPQGTARSNLSLQTSADQGKSWQKKLKLCAGGSAYSCLSLITSETVGCLYEAGYQNKGPEALILAKIPLALLRKDSMTEFAPKP